MKLDRTKAVLSMAAAKKTGQDIMNETGLSNVSIWKCTHEANISTVTAGLFADAVGVWIGELVKEV